MVFISYLLGLASGELSYGEYPFELKHDYLVV